jgi:hypothetical protein
MSLLLSRRLIAQRDAFRDRWRSRLMSPYTSCTGLDGIAEGESIGRWYRSIPEPNAVENASTPAKLSREQLSQPQAEMVGRLGDLEWICRVTRWRHFIRTARSCCAALAMARGFQTHDGEMALPNMLRTLADG